MSALVGPSQLSPCSSTGVTGGLCFHGHPIQRVSPRPADFALKGTRGGPHAALDLQTVEESAVRRRCQFSPSPVGLHGETPERSTVSSTELTEAQLLALRDLAAFYRAVIGTESQEHPLLSLWDAFDDPVEVLAELIAKHKDVFEQQPEDINLFELRDPEHLRNSTFDELSLMLQQEVEWASQIHSPNGLPVCGYETGQNADRLFSLVARAAQLVAEADNDPGAFPGPLFHEHPYIVFLRG